MRWLVLALMLTVAAATVAAPQFPALTGRVVDAAGMLSAGMERQISAMLEAHESGTTNQVVVVTVPDLQGYSIEEYGYQLGRHWAIGQKGRNNGVLLIVAKAERKVRIEVGYGLEGLLTDAIASNIINTVITPRFKRAQFDEGIMDGSAAVIAALGGEYKIKKTGGAAKRISPLWTILVIFLVFWVFPSMFGRGFFLGALLGGMLGGGRGRGRGGFGGGGFGGGGFSGGGGSFGGGGASGGW